MKNYIAPLGRISKAGNTKAGNIFAMWTNSYAEIWEKADGKQVVIFNAGRTSAKIGDCAGFYSDQSNRWMFLACLVSVQSMADLKGNITPMASYTYN